MTTGTTNGLWTIEWLPDEVHESLCDKCKGTGKLIKKTSKGLVHLKTKGDKR